MSDLPDPVPIATQFIGDPLIGPMNTGLIEVINSEPCHVCERWEGRRLRQISHLSPNCHELVLPNPPHRRGESLGYWGCVTSNTVVCYPNRATTGPYPSVCYTLYLALRPTTAIARRICAVFDRPTTPDDDRATDFPKVLSHCSTHTPNPQRIQAGTN